MRRVFSSYLFPCFLLCIGTVPLAATDAATPLPDTPQYSASLGSVTLNDAQLYRLAFRPDIPLGKWGLALDIELFLNKEGEFSNRGWEYDTSTELFNTILRKIYYVRYGKPHDKLHVKIGALDGVTLGHGLIIDNYRNTLQYPGIKHTGLQFHLKDIGSMQLGLEGFLNNFQDFQEGGALIGARLSATPVGKLELGITYVVDIDQYSGLVDSDNDGYPDAADAFPNDELLALDNDGDGSPDPIDIDDDNDGKLDVDEFSAAQIETLGNLLPIDDNITRKVPFNKNHVSADMFSMLGFDASYPIIAQKHLQLQLYGQAAFIIDDDDELSIAEAKSQGVTPGNRQATGIGLAAPGLWLQAGPLDGRLEFRHFQDDFDSNYFDNLYDLDRAHIDVASGRVTSKDALLVRGETLSGVFGRVGFDLGQFIYASADYQYLSGTDSPKQQLHASATLAKKLLQNIPRLQQARAYFQKNNIGSRLNENGELGSEDSFFEASEDTFFGYLVALEVNSGVNILWDTRFIYERDANLKLKRKKIMFIETQFVF